MPLVPLKTCDSCRGEFTDWPAKGTCEHWKGYVQPGEGPYPFEELETSEFDVVPEIIRCPECDCEYSLSEWRDLETRKEPVSDTETADNVERVAVARELSGPELLRELAAKLERGELDSVAVAAVDADGPPTIFWKLGERIAKLLGVLQGINFDILENSDFGGA